MTSSVPQRYTVGGVTYNSLDEMPADVRRKVESVLADRNGNGIPDVMEDFVMPKALAKKLGIVDIADSTKRARPGWMLPAILALAVIIVVVIVVALV